MAIEIVRFTLVYWSLWCTGHFGEPANALAVALTIARDVIVAPLVPSTPRTVCNLRIAFSVSVSAEYNCFSRCGANFDRFHLARRNFHFDIK